MAILPLSYVEEDRCERINGQLVPRPASGDTHSDIQENLRRLLSLQAKPLGMKARIVDPETRECFEHHGGDHFLKVETLLEAGSLSVAISDVFERDAV